MKLEIYFTEEQEKELVKGLFESYPEYSSPSLQCTLYDYDNFVFEFEDVEEDKPYKVELADALRGWRLFVKKVLEGKEYGDFDGNLFDAGCYDSIDTDAVLQCAIFGEVRYG